MCSVPPQAEEQGSTVNVNNAYHPSYAVTGSSSPRSLNHKTRIRQGAPAPLQVHASAYINASPASSISYMSDSTLALASHSPRTFAPHDTSMASHGPLSPATSQGNVAQYIDTLSINSSQLHHQHPHYPQSNRSDEVRSDMLPPLDVERRTHQSFDASVLASHHNSRRQSHVPSNRPDDIMIHGPNWAMPPSLSGGYTSAPSTSGYNATSIPAAFDPNYRRASVASFHTPDGQSPGSAIYSSAVAHPVAHSPLQRLEYGADSCVSPLKVGNAQLHASVSPLPHREPSFQSNAAFRQHMHSVGTPGFASHRSSISNSFSPTSPVNPADRRGFATPLLSRSTRSSESSAWTSVPSTPTPVLAPSGGNDKIGPSMLTEALISPRYDVCYTAPLMANNRSYSMASLGSTEESSIGSISMEGRGRSYSTSAVRNSTRTRPRHADPPLIVSSADKQYVCFCGKRFKRMEHLKRHSQVHTQERPYQCPIEACGRAFGRSDNLAQHMKTHARSADQTPRHTEETPPIDASAQLASPAEASSLRLGGAIALNEPNHSHSTLAGYAGNFTSSLSQYQ